LLQGRIALAGVLVVQDGVTLAERTALSILPGEANRCTVGQNGSKGQRFGLSPIDPALIA